MKIALRRTCLHQSGLVGIGNARGKFQMGEQFLCLVTGSISMLNIY